MTACRVLALDIGKSGCRAARYVDGHRVAENETRGADTLAGQDSAAASLAAADAAASTVRTELVDVVAAGVAGLASAPEAAHELAGRLAQRHDSARVILASDITTSHLGALDGAAGVVVAAGTGAVALAVGEDGATSCADGWGYLLGDAGSGFEIGRRGLHAALRAHDRRGGSDALLTRARERFGDPAGLPQLIHGDDNPARVIASFARDVLEAARAGDEWSGSVWTEAAVELARSTAAAAAGVFAAEQSVAVSTTGGLFDAGATLTDAFAAALATKLPGARLRARAGDALVGAHIMATRDWLPHENLLVRYSGAVHA